MTRTSAFTAQLTQFENGAILFPPPHFLRGEFSFAEPDVMAESATKLYPIGTLAWFPGIGKKFRYSYAGEALGALMNLVVNGNYVPDAASYANDGGFYGHCQEDGVASAYDVGETEIYVTGTQNTAKDFYAGGHLLHFDAARAVCYENSYVIAGPDSASTGTWQNQKITLATPKKYAIIASDGIEIWRNPYSNILEHDSAGMPRYSTSMGVNLVPVQSGYYFWLQTSGPILITPNGWGANCPGYAVDTRRIHVVNTGGIIQATTTANDSDQIIGVLLAATEAGSADAWINMNLDLGH